MNIMMELRQARTDKVEAMKALTTQAEVENRDFTEEEQATWDGLMTEVDSLEARMERMETLEAKETVFQTENRRAPAVIKSKLGDSETRSLAHYIRTGSMDRELRANDTIANEGTAADGLNAVPTGHYRNIIEKRDEMALFPKIGVMRIPGKGLTVNVPTDAATLASPAATSEQADNYANTFERDWPALGTVAMTLAKYTKKIALTEELLEDEDSNLMAFVEGYVARAMAQLHNTLLLTEARANGTAGLTLDSASTIAAAEVPELVHKLAEEYLDGAVWVMKRSTEGVIRGLSGNAFQFDPMPGGTGAGRSLWGYPVHASEQASAIAASAKSLIFGNFSFMGMREGDSLGVLRDPYTTDGIVYLKYRIRAVYKVLQAEAIQYATHPTA